MAGRKSNKRLRDPLPPPITTVPSPFTTPTVTEPRRPRRDPRKWERSTKE